MFCFRKKLCIFMADKRRLDKFLLKIKKAFDEVCEMISPHC